jgi:hypothetical protein
VFIGVHLRLKILKSSVLGVSPTFAMASERSEHFGILLSAPIGAAD